MNVNGTDLTEDQIIRLAVGPVRRPLTAEEAQAIQALQRVTYLPGSWDKRFARDVSYLTTITEKQAAQVRRLVHRYRRQIKTT